MLLRSVAWTMVFLASIIVQCGVSTANARALIDQEGRAFSLDSLHDAPIVLTFVSAHCKDACPTINAQIAQAANASRARALHFVTVTLDPDHDSVRDMQHLAKAYDANPAQWSFVTGTRNAIHALMQRFGVVAIDGNDHTTFVYLLNKQGRLAATILPSTDLASQISTEVSTL